MNNYKIKVNDEADSKEAQELFFALGAHWAQSKTTSFNPDPMSFIYFNGSSIYYGHDDENDECWFLSSSSGQELTLPQLRDLVVLHRNDIQDANWVTEGDDQIYQDSNGKSFIFREQGWDELQRHEMRQAMWEKVKPKPKGVELEQGLISGVDALRALADGKEIQWISTDFKNWNDLDIWNANLKTFLNEKYIAEGEFKFRLKPRTITLSLEIPAPFEPKEGDVVWFISDYHNNGYSSVVFEDLAGFQFGVWRTEEEIKKVVAAWRGGIKG